MSVLLRPDFPEDPMTLWYEIRTIADNRVLSRTHSIGSGSKWQCLKDVIRADAECDDEDIDIEETDDGDFITVDGKRYARIRSLVVEDYSDTEEHKQAMDEQEIFKANAAAQVELARLRAKVAYLEHEVDSWKERYDAADEALSQTIRDFDKLLNEVR
jgi:uncharacterized protein YlxW (UPF0749 family)